MSLELKQTKDKVICQVPNNYTKCHEEQSEKLRARENHSDHLQKPDRGVYVHDDKQDKKIYIFL